MAKPLLYYTVRPQTTRDGHTIYVPSLVDRSDSIPLDEIVRRAIDRGLIAGLKASAAKGVADAIARQMYAEFEEGNGIKFGSYFYARLYLDGTTNTNGQLTSANGINVRFTNGPSFKLSMDMFSFANVDDGDIPAIDWLLSVAEGISPERDLLIPDASVQLNGTDLYKADDAGTRVKFFGYDAETHEPEDEPSATVTTFTSRGKNMLAFAYPQGLTPGAKYSVVVERSADGSRWFTGAGHDVIIDVED